MADSRRDHQPVGSAVGRKTRNVLIFAILVVVSIVMLFPFYYMVERSFQSSNQFSVHAGSFSLVSWKILFETLPIFKQLLNSTIVTLSAILIILGVGTTAGYAFSKLKYPGSTTLFYLVVGSMMVPMQSIIIPEFVNLAGLRMVNHLYSAILVYGALGIPFGTFLITSFYRSIPNDIMDAGVVDGATYYGIYRRIMLPMATPALITVAVLQFIQIWDDLLVGLLFLQTPTSRTITVGLATLQSSHITQIPVLMGGSLISALPAAILYLIFQRYIVAGLTLGMNK
ncbi:MAG TPA: carbohydrate ABC transporter permease [Spirochaetia bacterium]|nr:carbohydrate ABC transporter permease [Spirochaetia bacterium]